MKYSVNSFRAQAYNFDSEYGQGVYFLFTRLCSQQGIGNGSLISAAHLYAKQWRKPVRRGVTTENLPHCAQLTNVWKVL